MRSCAQERRLMRMPQAASDLIELKIIEKDYIVGTCKSCRYEELPWTQEPCKGCQMILTRYEPKEVDNG